MKKMIVLVLCAIIAYSLSIVVHSSSNEYSGDVYAETEFQEVKAFSEEDKNKIFIVSNINEAFAKANELATENRIMLLEKR